MKSHFKPPGKNAHALSSHPQTQNISHEQETQRELIAVAGQYSKGICPTGWRPPNPETPRDPRLRQSALVPWIVQDVGMVPRPGPEPIAVPFMYQIARSP